MIDKNKIYLVILLSLALILVAVRYRIYDHNGPYDFTVKFIVEKENLKENTGIRQDIEVMKVFTPNFFVSRMRDPRLFNLRSKINIFLEHIDHQLFDTADVNIFMVNQEINFGRKQSLMYLTENDIIMCKSKLSEQLMIKYKEENNLKCKIINTGFTSIIKSPGLKYSHFYNKFSSIENFRKLPALHMAGKSPFKNTNLVIQAYKYGIDNNLDIGNIIIICRDLCIKANKKFLGEIIGDRKYDGKIMIFKNIEDITFNGIKFNYGDIFRKLALYICPSEAEGFGHYINESKYYFNIIVTTDNSPMNELIKDKETGYIIDTNEGDPIGYFGQKKSKFDYKELAKTIESIRSKPIDELKNIAFNAHIDFIVENERFKNNFSKMISDIIRKTN